MLFLHADPRYEVPLPTSEALRQVDDALADVPFPYRAVALMVDTFDLDSERDGVESTPDAWPVTSPRNSWAGQK